MQSINRGKRDRRIRIERATYARDDFNNLTPTGWNTVMNIWAEKDDISDAERTAAQEVGAEITSRFRVEWYQALINLTPKDRLFYGTREFGIVAVKEIGRRQGIEITAVARADK